MEIQQDIVQELSRVEQEEPVYEVQERKAGRLVKRSFDVFFSLLVLFLIFPVLFPVLWLLIRLESKGSVFFVQQRNGLHNKVFPCYKFRTMVVNKEADLIAATLDDARVTRIGRILRISGIDELPQFINVLRGDMSIVGPRPHMINDNLRFERVTANYRRRNLVRPGITGLAQVKGYKGNAVDEEDIRQRTRLDLEYIDQQSLFLDIKIVVATGGMMFRELFKLIKGK